MNSYIGLEALIQHHIEQLEREAAMARLAARAGWSPRPRYRQRLARNLRGFASRIDPSYEPAAGRATLNAAPAHAR